MELVAPDWEDWDNSGAVVFDMDTIRLALPPVLVAPEEPGEASTNRAFAWGP